MHGLDVYVRVMCVYASLYACTYVYHMYALSGSAPCVSAGLRPSL